jgi:hypothetical protein
VELIGPYLVACVLLVGAGAVKAWRPDDTARALAPLVPSAVGSRLGFLQMRRVVRGVATAEFALGAAAAALPRPLLAGCVAASYLAFAAVVAYARSRGGALASCGCFGRPDTPATPLHIALDLVLAVAAAVEAVSTSGAVSLSSVLSAQPLHGAPLLLLAAVGAWLTYLTLSLLAALHATRESVGSPAGHR